MKEIKNLDDFVNDTKIDFNIRLGGMRQYDIGYKKVNIKKEQEGLRYLNNYYFRMSSILHDSEQ